MSMTVGELVAYLRLDDKQFTKGLEAGERSLKQVGDKATEIGKKSSVGMTLPILAAGGMAVKLGADFETAMNQVAAATGAPAGELEKLSDYAKKMGADTMFSAGEAAAAMLELSKSGIEPAALQAGALKATMDLAAAGGLELADAAVVTSDAMHTFGLEAKDAAEIAAALAGGANASSADVSDLAQALSQVGPGAKNAGMSLDETVAVLASFADKGIKGSDAGTSLKTMLTNLVPATDESAKAMEQLGIDFTNADGSMKDITEIADILQDKMGGLSEEQRTLAMRTIFGSDATRAATVLMELGSDGLQKYTTATTDQGAAAEMAEARTKGMGGAIEAAQGSVETAAITFGEVLAPAVQVAADTLADVFNFIGGLPTPIKTLIVGVAGLAAAFGPVLVVVGKVLTAFGRIRDFRFRKAVDVSAKTTDATGGGTAATGVTKLGTASATSAAQVAGLGRAASTASGGAGKLGGATSTATGKVAKMGDKAKTAAPQLVGMGTSAKTATGKVGGLGGMASTARGKLGKFDTAMGNSTVGAIGASLAFGAALSFTIPKVMEAGSAFMSWMDALDQRDENRRSKEGSLKINGDTIRDKYGSVSAYLKHLRDTYGKDSPQYKNAIAALSLNEPKKPGRNRPIPNALGGDYMVTRPTLFLAGEAGPERATFTPKGKPGPGGGGVAFNNCTFVGQDPRALVAEVTRGVRRELALVAGTGF